MRVTLYNFIFHITATNKRRRNKITFFKDLKGNWIDDPPKIMEHTYTYFQHAFTTTHDKSNWNYIKSYPLNYKNNDLSSLDNPLTPSEIRNTIFSFKPFKSPDPDELHSFFFQKYWYIINSSVTNLFQQAFESGSLPDGINNTFLYLIPKILNANNLQNFRPIGLCNTIYKVVTKITSNRKNPT